MIAAVFVLKLTAGITLMWWLMPRKDVTDGFFRIQMRVLLGLCVLAALLFSVDSGGELTGTLDTSQAAAAKEVASVSPSTLTFIRNLCLAACFVSYLGSIFWALGRRLPGNLCIYTLLFTCVAAMVVYSRAWATHGTLALQLLADTASAGVLGGMLTGMLLGHWYLTTPTMSLKPLLWFNVAILVAAVLRLLASAWAIGVHGSAMDPTQQIWLGMRWLGGIVTPIVTTLLVWRIMKHRNTQSATGVLFAGLILVFMGEMTAILLERATFVPY